MKKICIVNIILLLLLVTITCNMVTAQNKNEQTKKDTVLAQPANLGITKFINSIKPATWSIQASFGSVLYYGDLRQYDFYPMSNKSLNSDLIKKQDEKVADSKAVVSTASNKASDRKWGGGISILKQFGGVFSVELQFIYGKMGAASYQVDDLKTDPEQPLKANGNAPLQITKQYYFNSTFHEFDLNAHINMNKFLFPSQPSGRLNFYLLAGVGLNTFKSGLYDLKTGDKLNGSGKDAGMLTEKIDNGKFTTFVTTEQKTTEVVFPLGLGFRYHITPRFSAILEGTLRSVNSDKIDSWKVTNSNNDKYSYICLGLNYSFGDVADSLLEAKLKPKYDLQKKTRAAKSKLELKIDSLEKVLGDVGHRLGTLEYGFKDMNDTLKNLAKKIEVPTGGLNTMQFTATDAVTQLLVVFFDFNSTIIKPQYHERVALIAKILKSDPKLSIQIIGHADKKGSEKYNMELSRKRAEAVKNELVNSYGIDPSRLSHIVQKGKSDPLSGKYDDVNRRVDFIFSR